MIDHVLSLLVTILVEFFILWLLTRRPVLSVLLYSLLINTLTQPIATYLYQKNNISELFVVEAGVVLVESVLIMLLFKLKYGRALLFSFLANLTTTLIAVAWFGRI